MDGFFDCCFVACERIWWLILRMGGDGKRDGELAVMIWSFWILIFLYFLCSIFVNDLEFFCGDDSC